MAALAVAGLKANQNAAFPAKLPDPPDEFCTVHPQSIVHLYTIHKQPRGRMNLLLKREKGSVTDEIHSYVTLTP